MSCNSQRARLLIKRGSGKPTIPTSPDHTDGSWLVTDIYVGEQYMDTDSGVIYTRTLSDEIVNVSELIPETKRLIFTISQTGVNAPTVDDVVYSDFENTNFSTSYASIGEYEITPPTGVVLNDMTRIIANNSTYNKNGKINGVMLVGINTLNNKLLIETRGKDMLSLNGVLEGNFIELVFYPNIIS